MSDALVKLIGWRATVLHGDPCVYDRWKWLARQLSPGRLRTLDAGCGSGAFTMYASRIGNITLGLSFDERNNRAAQARARILCLRNIRFTVGDLRDLDQFGERLGTFDQIICFETIEHHADDAKPVGDLSARLAPGGKLLLTTPYKNYKPLMGDHVSAYEDGGQVRWGYIHEEMRALFNKHGLDIVVEDYISGLVAQQLTNLVRMLAKANVRLAWPVTLPLRVLQLFDRSLTRRTGYPYQSIGVVGIKRA